MAVPLASAKAAGLHLQLRPGTDGALLLALLQVIPTTAQRLGLVEGAPGGGENSRRRSPLLGSFRRWSGRGRRARRAWRWFPERTGPGHGWRENCVNLLYGHGHFDPQSGAETLRGVLCRVERAGHEMGEAAPD
jgi:hypothetical protein